MKRSWLGLVLPWFPITLLVCAVGISIVGVINQALWALLAVPTLLYLVPPLLHRLHERFFPLQFGSQDLIGLHYVPWWGSHQLQLIYFALPVLEAVLRLIPGVYSTWLRLWGAKVGRRVYWTPLVEIADRSLITIGDDVVLGHRCKFTAHMVNRVEGNVVLYVKPIVIEDRALIGTLAGLGPGAHVGSGHMVPAQGRVTVNEKVP